MSSKTQKVDSECILYALVVVGTLKKRNRKWLKKKIKLLPDRRIGLLAHMGSNLSGAVCVVFSC